MPKSSVQRIASVEADSQVRSRTLPHQKVPLPAAIGELLATLPLGLIALDEGGSIALVNATAATLLGVQPEALCGQPTRDVLTALREHSGGNPAIDAQLDQLEASLGLENSLPGALSSPISIGPSHPLAITALEVAGQRLLVLTEHDEAPSSPRRTADDGLTDLVAGAALAMVPRLNVIEDAASALRTAPRLLDPALYARNVREIADSARQIRASLVALEDILRLRRGSESLRVAPLDLTDLVMTLLAHWKTAAPAHSLELSLPGEVPGIIADAARLEQAINQLIEHVIKFAVEGESIRVTIRPGDEEILLSVRHSGRVVRLDQLKQTFQPLLPTSGGDDHDYGYRSGGELGLALVRAVTLAHGGRVWAQLDEQDATLTVFLALPLVPPEVASPDYTRTEDAASPVGAAIPAPRLPLKRESPVALVADGEARMTRFLGANLEAQRYRVVVARDLDDIYRHIDLEEPDVLLLDSTLPGLEKPETLQRLGSYASAPLILLAPHADPLDCARALDLGAADYIAKPFSVEELLARVRAALRKHESLSRASTRESSFTSGDLHIDFSLHQVRVGGKTVQLSKTEFKLLRALAQHADMVLAHEVLLERVWGPGYSREVDFVWVYIRRLRRKIEPDPSHPKYILTVPGVGYRLARI